MNRAEIVKKLFGMQDTAYRNFQSALIPALMKEKIIGVRTPQLRRLARQIAEDKDINLFLRNLPHSYFEEDQLHAFVISYEKDFEACIKETERFLPYVDNWATCDQFSPAVFGSHTGELLPYAEKWMHSDHVYTIRFGIGMMMRYFLKDCFEERFLHEIAEICSDEYYVNMMRAWYFATALAFQYDKTVRIMEDNCLDSWTFIMTVRKALDSTRIPQERKTYLRMLRKKISDKTE